MSKQSSGNLRLDEILIRENLVSEEEIREALLRQKAHGGKVGSQLLYHRYIDEAGLVKALTIQFGCEGVVLAKLHVPEAVLQLIPKQVAIARKVFPFDYALDTNVLKVACENPTDEGLINELNFVARGKQVRLYVAAELSLNTTIARHYLGRDVSLEDSLLLDIPDEATDTGGIPAVADPEEPPEAPPVRGDILLVTDEEYCAPLLQSVFERDDYRVTVTDSADEAIELIGDKQFHTVLIKDTVPGDYLDLIDRLRKSSPRTVVRYYESAASLIVRDDVTDASGEMLLKNLDLFTSLLASRDKLGNNHSATVGHYVDKLCRHLGLPDKERLMIANAAYLHDLAKFYYSADSTKDPRTTIRLSVKLLRSLNYSPVVSEILRAMYIDLKSKYTKRLPIEVLGGNILTIVDLFCDNVPAEERLSLDKFDAIKKKVHDLTGKLFLQEVVEAFITMVQEEILTTQTSERACQVMLYSEDPALSYPLQLRLKNEGFRLLSHTDIDSFVDLYKRSKPDILVLLLPGDPGEVTGRVERLGAGGIDFRNTPSFLLVEGTRTSDLTILLETGIEDVIALGGNPDILVLKMQKIQLTLEENRLKKESMSAHGGTTTGRLADMNLIDLLQALGPSRKTARITISTNSEAPQELELFLHSGAIVYARLGDMSGADAVYEAIGWGDGQWTIEPVAAGDLPEPNNHLPNESILMEGCRLLDEKVRGKVF